ncbi:hypothetical protein BGZ80_008379, partial [Entomortierella chlamydospora]
RRLRRRPLPPLPRRLLLTLPAPGLLVRLTPLSGPAMPPPLLVVTGLLMPPLLTGPPRPPPLTPGPL